MVGSILVFILVLSVLVLVHELGHFFAARRAGVWVEEFGFGLPPRVFGKKIGETIYSINLLPFGGFVRLHGESSEQEITNPKRAFLNQNKKVRSAIVVAGVLMNLLLAVFAFGLTSSFRGIPRETGEVKIEEITSGSPAEEKGIIAGEIVRKVDDVNIISVTQFIDEVDKRKGQEIVLAVENNGTLREVNIVPRVEPPEGEGALGVVISSIEMYFPPLWQRPFVGVYQGFREAMFWGGVVIAGFIQLFSQLFKGVVPQEVAGPVGIFAMTSKAAEYGIITLINFVGILSINLAILNILPFPALDGGRLFFILIESVLGKKVLPKAEAIAHTVGIIVLILILLAVTANDVRRLIEGGGIQGFIDSVVE